MFNNLEEAFDFNNIDSSLNDTFKNIGEHSVFISLYELLLEKYDKKTNSYRYDDIKIIKDDKNKTFYIGHSNIKNEEQYTIEHHWLRILLETGIIKIIVRYCTKFEHAITGYNGYQETTTILEDAYYIAFLCKGLLGNSYQYEIITTEDIHYLFPDTYFTSSGMAYMLTSDMIKDFPKLISGINKTRISMNSLIFDDKQTVVDFIEYLYKDNNGKIEISQKTCCFRNEPMYGGFNHRRNPGDTGRFIRKVIKTIESGKAFNLNEGFNFNAVNQNNLNDNLENQYKNLRTQMFHKISDWLMDEYHETNFTNKLRGLWVILNLYVKIPLNFTGDFIFVNLPLENLLGYYGHGFHALLKKTGVTSKINDLWEKPNMSLYLEQITVIMNKHHNAFIGDYAEDFSDYEFRISPDNGLIIIYKVIDNLLSRTLVVAAILITGLVDYTQIESF